MESFLNVQRNECTAFCCRIADVRTRLDGSILNGTINGPGNSLGIRIDDLMHWFV